eukprot:scaffold39950_cov72-Phaeocystis_antarctica.AAC.1
MQAGMCGAHVEHVAHGRGLSKLSGWLNAAADCRECTMRSEVWAGGGRAWAGGCARAACMARGPGCEGWGKSCTVLRKAVDHDDTFSSL